MCDLATALQLAKSVPIFPCAPDKKPLTPRGLKDASQDPVIITGWWERWPNALPAQPTGISTTVVTDIDTKDGTPAAERSKILFNGHGSPPTYIYTTRSGGWHIHYRSAELTRNSVEKLAPNVDFRGDGGYVVRWDAEGCRVLCDEDPAPIPEWLFDRVKADRRPKADQAPTGADIGEGRRNATLASMAGTMRRRGMSVEAIEAALQAENAARCNPPLDEAEVRQIAVSVGRYAPEDQGVAPEPETEPPDWRFDAPPLGDEEPAPAPVRTVSFGDLVAGGPIAPPPVLLDGILPIDVVGLVAPGGSGKTTLILALMIHCVLGRPIFGGLRFTRTGPCVLVSAEDDREKLGYRVQEMARHMDLSSAEMDALKAGIHFFDLTGVDRCALVEAQPDGLRFTSLVSTVIETYAPIHPVLIAFDPANYFGPGERHVNDGEASLMRAGRRILNDTGATVLFSAHTSKEVARNQIIDQYVGRGGAAFADNARSLIVLAGHKTDDDGKYPPPRFISCDDVDAGNVMRLHVEKFSFGPRIKEPFWIVRHGWEFDLHRPMTQEDRDRHQAVQKNARLVADMQDVYAALDELRKIGEHPSENDLGAHVVASTSVSRDRYRAAVHQLKSGQFIKKMPLPEGVKHRGRTDFLTPVNCPPDGWNCAGKTP